MGILFSCKKDRICECTVVESGTSTTTASVVASFAPPPLPPISLFDTSFSTGYSNVDTRSIKIKKATKKQAKNYCLSYEEPFVETSYNSVPNFSLTTTKKATRSYDCKLK